MKPSPKKNSKLMNFKFAAKPGSEVYVAGSFNNWDPKATPLKDMPQIGLYATALRIPPGRHEYKFIVNGKWCTDPQCAESAPNSHGSLNSVVTV